MSIKHNWIVLTCVDPLPHETCRDAYAERAGHVIGPHYAAGSRWYTPGWGKNYERNRRHVDLMAATWGDRGYRMVVTEELR